MVETRSRFWGPTAAALLLTLLAAFPLTAQAFTSGSTGALGAFNPGVNTLVTLPADGILNYTTVTIPSGVTVTFTRNAGNTPVTLLATGDVTITGTISVKGATGVAAAPTGPHVNAGGLGGPGGYTGGSGGSRGLASTNGTPGQGSGGGIGAILPSATALNGAYGADASFVGLIPLFGGSGGGGGAGTTTNSGNSAGGGGGGIVIASTTQITVNATGKVTANGGDGFADPPGTGACSVYAAGTGSGGAVRLVSNQITVSGTLQATKGNGTCTTYPTDGTGRIRLEATTLSYPGTPTITPTASTTSTPGPVTAASTPALVNVPTLTISSVAAVNAPASPAGSYTTPDISLPTVTTNPVTVTLTATNIPVGIAYTVTIIPQFGPSISYGTGLSTGTVASSTATAIVTMPPGQTSVLTASTSFTLAAGGFPLFDDGDSVERIMVAAGLGEPTTVTLLTRSGKALPAAQVVIEGIR